MIDTRAVTWKYLFPSDTSYAWVGAPTCLRDFLGPSAAVGRPSVLVAWDGTSAQLPDLDSFSGLVAINCGGLSACELRTSGFDYVRRFAVLPSLANPRWFVPLDSTAVSSAAFRLYTPFQTMARLKLLGVRTVARTGLPVWYRDQFVIAQRTMPPIERVLKAVFPSIDLRVAIATGTPGPDRKPTAAILSMDGGTLGFAKLSCSAVSAQLIEHEATILRALACVPHPVPLAPRLLFAGEVDGTVLTIQDAVPGSPGPRQFTGAHRLFLTGLSQGNATRASSAVIVDALHRRVEDLSSPRSDLLSAFYAVLPVVNRLVLPTTIVHGDFAPWNVRSHHGDIAAFDWEYGEVEGLPLLDEIQHLLQVGFFLDNWSVEQARDRLRELEGRALLNLLPEGVRALQVLSILGLLVRGLRRYERGYEGNAWLIDRYQRLLSLLVPTLLEGAA
jgi:hypothetical protein